MRWIGIGFGVCACLLVFAKAKAIEAVVSKTVFYAQEQGKKGQPFAEIIFQVNPNTIHFYQNRDSLWQSKVETHILFKNETGVVKEEHFLLQTPPTDYESAAIQIILDLHRYPLPPGKIQLELSMREKDFPDNVFYYSDSFTIKEPANSSYYGGIQLLDTTYKTSRASIFQRNGQLQIPLSSNFLNDGRGILHFYTELYQSDLVDTAQYPLVQRVYISRKPNDAALLKLQNTDTIQVASVLPFIGSFNIMSLPSGNYYLNAVLENKDKEVLARQSLFFQRSNKNPVAIAKDTTADTGGMEKVNILDLSTTFLGKYSFPQIKAILKMMLPISTATEALNINAFLNKPEEVYMRYFIYNFWKSRNNTDPKKPWDEYVARVKEVNKLFGRGSTPGYETEQGILYLKYGKPTERVVVTNETGSLPYEIWHYNALPRQGGGGVFLFYNPQSMITDFRLLHSTVNGEVRNTAWRSTLYTNGANPNARAEQYLKNR
jgi:GWxTD domain-containing protein